MSEDWSLKGVPPHEGSEKNVLLPEKAKLDANKKRNVLLPGTTGHRRGFESQLVCDIFMLSWLLCISKVTLKGL